MKGKKCIAMLLAGGQGSRLSVLTKNIAKPAVSFGGKYKIIDFPLSNCVNSGIDTVGVLTQYQPLELNYYIGNGQPWDLDRMNGGAAILPPYMTSTRGDWYKGTANAIYQNINFIEAHNPDHVLILSGDHVYKMNYEWMLNEHIAKGADCTIAVVDVPLQEAPRFGIMNADETGKIYEFEEKPENPKSTKASMGVYIFSWPILKKYLLEDENEDNSSNDFGKDIIPKMLADGQKMYTYEFKGYWKDVGTIESLWSSNMDCLDESSGLVLNDPGWRIYARNPILTPQYISDYSKIKNSMISGGCQIYGEVENSVISYDVCIEEGAFVSNSIIMPGAVIEENARVEYAIVAEKCVIKAGSFVGYKNDLLNDDIEITVVGADTSIEIGELVPSGAIVEKGVEV